MATHTATTHPLLPPDPDPLHIAALRDHLMEQHDLEMGRSILVGKLWGWCELLAADLETLCRDDLSPEMRALAVEFARRLLDHIRAGGHNFEEGR